MKCYDIREDISRRVAEAIEAEPGLGVEKFGYSVSMLLGQGGGKDVTIWMIVISCRSPLLGQPDIGITSKFQGNTIQDAPLIAAVKKSIAVLREEFQRKLAAGPVPPSSALPAGLHDRRLN